MPFANLDTLNAIQPVTNVSFKVKALIYGPPGAGKTIMAANSPAPLELDADGTGSLSILNHPELAIRTMALQVRSYEQMIDVFEGYLAGDPRVAWVETFIIDTMSQLTKIHLDARVQSEMARSSSHEAIPYQLDYKFNTEAMRRVVDLFRSLDTNLVVLCHEEEKRDDLSGMVSKRPYLTPRLVSSMEAVFDVFGYMTAETMETPQGFVVNRSLQVMPTRRIMAKTRIGGLPPIIADPTFQNLIDAKEVMLWKVQNYMQQLQAAYAQGSAVPERPEGIILPGEPTPVEPIAEEIDAQPFRVGGAFTPAAAASANAAERQ